MDTFKPAAHSLRPLTSSSQMLTSGSQKSAEKVAFSTERARLLLGQFRRGEANDPATFITSVAAVLARYSEAVVLYVTDPRTGLASKGDWLPTIHEIVAECEKLEEAGRRLVERKELEEKTLRERAEFEAKSAKRPSLDELRAKYGPNWGLSPVEKTDAEHERKKAARAVKEMAASERKILDEYKRLNRDPVYAADGIVVSPELVDLLEPFRHSYSGQ